MFIRHTNEPNNSSHILVILVSCVHIYRLVYHSYIDIESCQWSCLIIQSCYKRIYLL